MWSKCESKQQIRCVKQQNWEPTSKYQGWSTKSLGCDMMWIFATKMTMISSANMEMFIRLLQVFVSTEKWGGKTLVSFCSPQNGCLSGWWFGTWILFSLYWEFDHPNWLTHIFQRGRAQAPTSCGCLSPKRFGCIPKFPSSDARMPCSFQTPGFSCRSSLLQLSQRFSQELRLVNQPIWGIHLF